jgi:hypothetical protein
MKILRERRGFTTNSSSAADWSVMYRPMAVSSLANVMSSKVAGIADLSTVQVDAIVNEHIMHKIARQQGGDK